MTKKQIGTLIGGISAITGLIIQFGFEEYHLALLFVWLAYTGMAYANLQKDE